MDVVNSLILLQEIVFVNANKNPKDSNDLLGAGKQEAYSHIYFDLEKILNNYQLA